MTLQLYNSLTRRVEPFEPLTPGEVRMYTCGPTVYDRAHIGNFRTFLWEDLLRRYLKWKGFSVHQVMNLTDVDDRTITAAAERGVPLEQVTEPVIEQFFGDWRTLGLEPVEEFPRATEHVSTMIELVQRLEARGLTYSSEGSVYFPIGRFPEYGKLVNLDPESVAHAGRAAGDEEYAKDDPRDFVLWKGGERSEEGEVAVWDSPWGVGRPGWHLECSAMAMHYLGETLDIHTGGVDNMFPHHTNEIAQSEGATGEPFARYWLHAAHLLIDGGKMSKSLGNCYTISELLEVGHSPSAIRYLLLSGHYRTQLNFTFEGLEKAARSLDRVEDFGRRLAQSEQGETIPAPGVDLGDLVDRVRGQFEAALDDDLNVSEALAAVFTLVREGNQRLDEAGEGTPGGVDAARGFLGAFDGIFGVLALRESERQDLPSELQDWVLSRIADREEARRKGDYARADLIREEVEARGFSLEDAPDGTRWKRRAETASIGDA